MNPAVTSLFCFGGEGWEEALHVFLDPDGLFSAPAASREGRIVFEEPETPMHDPDAPKTVPQSPIHVWRARAARHNGHA